MTLTNITFLIFWLILPLEIRGESLFLLDLFAQRCQTLTQRTFWMVCLKSRDDSFWAHSDCSLFNDVLGRTQRSASAKQNKKTTKRRRKRNESRAWRERKTFWNISKKIPRSQSYIPELYVRCGHLYKTEIYNLLTVSWRQFIRHPKKKNGESANHSDIRFSNIFLKNFFFLFLSYLSMKIEIHTKIRPIISIHTKGKRDFPYQVYTCLICTSPSRFLVLIFHIFVNV